MNTRREFIKKTFRLAALTAIASTSGYLLLNRDEAGNCDLDFGCSNCQKKGCNIRKEDYNKSEKLKSNELR